MSQTATRTQVETLGPDGRRPKPEWADEIECHCRKKAKAAYSMSENNRHKWFFVCENRDNTTGCKFWKWETDISGPGAPAVPPSTPRRGDREDGTPQQTPRRQPSPSKPLDPESKKKLRQNIMGAIAGDAPSVNHESESPSASQESTQYWDSDSELGKSPSSGKGKGKRRLEEEELPSSAYKFKKNAAGGSGSCAVAGPSTMAETSRTVRANHSALAPSPEQASFGGRPKPARDDTFGNPVPSPSFARSAARSGTELTNEDFKDQLAKLKHLPDHLDRLQSEINDYKRLLAEKDKKLEVQDTTIDVMVATIKDLRAELARK